MQVLDGSVLPAAQEARPGGERGVAPAGRFRVWPADAGSFSADRIVPLRHDFHAHPLLQLPALAELAKALMPTGQCRFIRPGTRQGSEFLHDPKSPDGRGIDEIFARIEETGSWVALYNVETQPAYQALLGEIIDTVRPLVEAQQPGIHDIGGFIFISAPPSVTPFHIDRENNFWLQLQGRKTMNVWPHTDREVVAQEAVEEFVLTGRLDRVRLDEALRDHSREFDVGPGDGVYFPSTSPHMTATDRRWVRPGDAVSVSIGVVFYSDVTRRHVEVHRMNRLLRRLGVQPAPPGAAAARDRVKATLAHALRMLKTALRGAGRSA